MKAQIRRAAIPRWIVMTGLLLFAGMSIVAIRGQGEKQVDGRSTTALGISIAKTFKSWGELKGASTLIAFATAGTQQGEIGVQGFPWTTTSVHVEQVLRGSAQVGQTVLVRQVGGTAGGRTDVADEFPLLSPGTRYLLFLTPSPLSGQWYPVGAFQGVFTVSADGMVNSLVGGTAGGMTVKDMALSEVVQAVQAAPAMNVSP
jgi:hypothetical protein